MTVFLACIISLTVGVVLGLAAEWPTLRAWKTTAAAYERQVAFDEAELEQLRGPRHSPDLDDPTRGVR